MHRIAVIVLLASVAAGCPSDDTATPNVPADTSDAADVSADADADPSPWIDAAEEAGVQVMMAFGRAGGFYDAPFPSEDLRGADGRPDLDGFPNPKDVDFVALLVDIVERTTDGFGTTSGVFFQLTGAPAAALPDVAATVDASDRRVRLMAVSEGSPDRFVPVPASVGFHADGGPHGAPNLLSVLPIQGFPLRPHTLYAAVVSRSLGDDAGQPLGRSAQLAALLRGKAPDGLSGDALEAYREAVTALAEDGWDLASIAGLAVFRTGDPVSAFGRFRDHALAQPLPELTPWEAREVFDGFCVYEARAPMPVYQAGDPPFSTEGGAWAVGADGEPEIQAHEDARIFVTVPRGPTPEGGWPVVVFVRTGGGGDRPLIDRGVRAEHGVAGEPGLGPAMNFAAGGWAGVQIDGPHGGIRNVTLGDEQFLMFNVTNPEALRDNVRQSALELSVLARMLGTMAIDASGCPDAGGTATFDTEHVALMGHSMGATIAPLALAYEPMFRAGILSGAGGSYLENVVHKKSPLEVKPIAELMLDYTKHELHEHDPILSVLQWGSEPADPPVYARHVQREPFEGQPRRHVLMLQGIVDTYILPAIANTTSLSMGLDLGGPALDAGNPELTEFTPLEALLPLGGRSRVDLPAGGNADGVTALVIQHAEDGIEDGHEVAFQKEAPKHQYRCFLEDLAADRVPQVPAGGGQWDACEP